MKRIIYVCFLALFLSSCTTDNDDNSQPEDSNFYALTVGNSWEYRWYGVSSEGVNVNPNSVAESISIVGTEEINNKIYYKFSRVISGNDPQSGSGLFPYNGEYSEFYRDSLGYLVNEEGLIKFSNSAIEEFQIIEYHDNFGIINGQSVGAILYGELLDEEINYSSDAGTFQCLKVSTRIVYDGGSEAPANNSIYYSDGIGLISDDIVYVSSENNVGYRRNLVSYSIQ